MENMNKDVKIDGKNFEMVLNKMNSLNKDIKELLDSIDLDMKNLHNSNVWSGDANDAYYRRYEELSKLFPIFNEGLSIYCKYLRSTLDNYTNFDYSTGNDIDRNISNFNVN